jgi:hypothetical protein
MFVAMGFGLLELLTIACVASALALLVGWAFYQSFRSPEDR